MSINKFMLHTLTPDASADLIVGMYMLECDPDGNRKPGNSKKLIFNLLRCLHYRK